MAQNSEELKANTTQCLIDRRLIAHGYPPMEYGEIDKSVMYVGFIPQNKQNSSKKH